MQVHRHRGHPRHVEPECRRGGAGGIEERQEQPAHRSVHVHPDPAGGGLFGDLGDRVHHTVGEAGRGQADRGGVLIHRGHQLRGIGQPVGADVHERDLEAEVVGRLPEPGVRGHRHHQPPAPPGVPVALHRHHDRLGTTSGEHSVGLRVRGDHRGDHRHHFGLELLGGGERGGGEGVLVGEQRRRLVHQVLVPVRGVVDQRPATSTAPVDVAGARLRPGRAHRFRGESMFGKFHGATIPTLTPRRRRPAPGGGERRHRRWLAVPPRCEVPAAACLAGPHAAACPPPGSRACPPRPMAAIACAR